MARQKHLPLEVTMPNGELFEAVTLRITDRFEDGAPSELQVIPKDSSVEMPVPEEFVLAYVRKGSI